MSTSKKLKSEQLFVRVETVMHDLQISRPFASKFEFSAEWKNYHSKRRDWFTDERISKNAKSERKQPQRK